MTMLPSESAFWPSHLRRSRVVQCFLRAVDSALPVMSLNLRGPQSENSTSILSFFVARRQRGQRANEVSGHLIAI